MDRLVKKGAEVKKRKKRLENRSKENSHLILPSPTPPVLVTVVV